MIILDRMERYQVDRIRSGNNIRNPYLDHPTREKRELGCRFSAVRNDLGIWG